MEERVYQDILDQMVEGVYFVDRSRRITYWNHGAQSITGYAADEVLGHSCAEGILRHVDEAGAQLCAHGCPLRAVMIDGRSRGADVYLHHRDGHRVPVTVRGQAIRDGEGAVVGSVELFHTRPATRFAAHERDDVVDDPYTDPLTGIGTRRLADQTLEPVLAAVAGGETSLGVMFLDVDHFKQVNDALGHLTGDRVLRMVGQTLANGLRSTDIPVRWGGEEFVALLPGADQRVLEATAERVRMLVENSWIQKGDLQVRVTVSVGATMAVPGEGAEAVLERADRFMYASKATGRNRVTTTNGALPRRSEPPLLGTAAPWDMVGVDAER